MNWMLVTRTQIKLNPGLIAALYGESSSASVILIIIIITLFVSKFTKCCNLKHAGVSI